MIILENIPEYLNRAWRELEQKGSETKWNAIRLPNLPNERAMLLAIDESGLHHFLVPAENARYQTNTRSPLSVNVGEQSFIFVDGTTVFGRFVDIYCGLSMLNDQFDLVIASVLKAVVTASDPARRAITTVNSWRRLFATMAAAPKLTLPEKYGVFAELKILDFLQNSREDFSGKWWTGPRREPHDFELPDLSLEVKAVSAKNQVISINGHEQLETRNGKPLYLLLVSIQEDSTGLTIGELLDSVVDGSADEKEIRNRAASAGIFGSADDDDRFRMTKIAGTRVTQDFPRITVDSFSDTQKEAITRVSYDLKLASIETWFSFAPPGDIGSVING